MGKLGDRYFSSLGYNLRDSRSYARIELALNRAYQLRTFEIEHYWKRATYFWGFQIAIFAAFGLIWRDTGHDPWSPITVALAGLGILTAVANSLSAAGSKFWQENWENHIDMLSNHTEGRLHRIVWLQNGKKGFSVSRINQQLGFYCIGFWILIFIFVAWRYLGFEIPNLFDEKYYRGIYVGVMLFVVMLCVAFLFRQTTKLNGTLPDVDGNAGVPFARRSPWCRRINAAGSREFVLRFAPDDEHPLSLSKQQA